MSPETEAATETQPAPGPVRVSIVAQLDPLWRPGRIGETGITELEDFAKGMTAYVAENLERFAETRGADVFVRVVIDRDGETGGHEYRSGHFLDEAGNEGGSDSAGRGGRPIVPGHDLTADRLAMRTYVRQVNCSHLHLVTVETLDGEQVGFVCPDCDAGLDLQGMVIYGR